ncbi:hypothetical protein [Nocardiopsis ganjiahuensis]|uniref:hypothetical protein n=1 Tax=Nocardiopsis ganjiahuensis TaxID=239984 RepID=UPI0003481DE5|nr:hypothetical protein [Nocardiopsis ganjiahuensis]
MTEHLWALFALTLASALAYLLIPNPPARAAIAPAPEGQQGSEDFPCAESRAVGVEGSSHDPDQIAGALVRPYLSPVPRPRVPVGDLLAATSTEGFDDLAEVVRTYLRVCG